MGGCTSCNKEARSKTQCKFCSTALPQQRDHSSTKCQYGHTVCQKCMTRADDGELHCPHCQVVVPQKRVAEPAKPHLEIPKKSSEPIEEAHIVEEQHPPTIQQYSVLHQQKDHQHPYIEPTVGAAGHQEPPKEQVHQPMKQTLFQQGKNHEPKQQALQPAKPSPNDTENNKAEQKPFQKKVCGCSIQNFLVVIVLIVQTLFTAASMYYSYSQPKSECMDVSHTYPIPPMRPLMQQISGVETTITLIMTVSAFIYKRGCLSEPIFDNWMIFLKFLLSTKQLLWTALQTFMQMVIMPLYCDPGIMKFTLITSVANLVSFLLVIIKPVYTFISQKCCCCCKKST